MQVSQGKPVVFRVSARRPAAGRIESEAAAAVRVWSPGLEPQSDKPSVELSLEWSSQALRYTGRLSTEGWQVGRHTAVAEVRDLSSGELLGEDVSSIVVTEPKF